MKSISKKSFNAEIGIDNGYTNTSQGKRKFTMELFSYEDEPVCFQIEWDIPSMETTTHIGIWCNWKNFGSKELEVTDYDGVFEFPLEAIELLEENGINCDEMRKSMELPEKQSAVR